MNNCSRCKQTHDSKQRYCVVCKKLYAQEYYLKHRDKLLKRALDWQARTNYTSSGVYIANKRAKLNGHLDQLTLNEVREFIKLHPACQDCGSNKKLSIGHKIPLIYPCSNNRIENLIRQCMECNRAQGLQVHFSSATDEMRKYLPIWQKVKST